MPLISVVIPLYNKELSVQRAIKSVLNQSFQDFELIIVDDGSTDRSYIKAEELSESRITLIRQNNSGVSKARNKGVALAKAPYVAFLDADDAYHESFLATMASMLTHYPDAAFYCCRFEVVDELGRLMQTKSALTSGFCGVLADFFISYKKDRLLICPSSFMANKAQFQRVGGFAEDAAIGEDIHLWIQLALQGQVIANDKIATTMFRNAENRTAGKAARTISKYADYYLATTDWQDKLSGQQISSVYALVCHYAFIQACVALSVQQKENAKNYAKLLAPHHQGYAFLLKTCYYLLPSSLLRLMQRIRNTLNRVKSV